MLRRMRFSDYPYILGDSPIPELDRITVATFLKLSEGSPSPDYYLFYDDETHLLAWLERPHEFSWPMARFMRRIIPPAPIDKVMWYWPDFAARLYEIDEEFLLLTDPFICNRNVRIGQDYRLNDSRIHWDTVLACDRNLWVRNNPKLRTTLQLSAEGRRLELTYSHNPNAFLTSEEIASFLNPLFDKTAWFWAVACGDRALWFKLVDADTGEVQTLSSHLIKPDRIILHSMLGNEDFYLYSLVNIVEALNDWPDLQKYPMLYDPCLLTQRGEAASLTPDYRHLICNIQMDVPTLAACGERVPPNWRIPYYQVKRGWVA